MLWFHCSLFFYNVTLILHYTHLKQYGKLKKAGWRKRSYEPWCICKKCKFKFSLQHITITWYMRLGLNKTAASLSSVCSMLVSFLLTFTINSTYSPLYTPKISWKSTKKQRVEGERVCLSLSARMSTARSRSASSMLWTHSALTSPLIFLSLSTIWD